MSSNKDWNRDKETGEKYQDCIFYTLSVVLKTKIDGKDFNPLQWSSKYYQMLLGESYSGFEVKYNRDTVADGKLGGVFIATLENDYKKTTGILQTECSHYVIGNQYLAYVFKTEDLRNLYQGLKEGKRDPEYFLYRKDGKEGIVLKPEYLKRISRDYRTFRNDLNSYNVAMIPVYKPYLHNNKVYPVSAYKDDRGAEIECRKIEQAYRGIRDIIER